MQQSEIDERFPMKPFVRVVDLTDLGEKMEKYSEETFKPTDPILEEVIDRQTRLNMPPYQVGKMDGLHLEILLRLGGHRKVVEVGTLAGYSGIIIARALPSDGTLDTIDLCPEFAEIARESFRKAGVDHKITVHVGDAVTVLEQLSPKGPFDAVFIDADKNNYKNYLDWAEKNLRVGGAMIADNTFGFGYIDEDITRIESEHLRDCITGLQGLNNTVANSPRWRATILPTRHGITVAVKIA